MLLRLASLLMVAAVIGCSNAPLNTSGGPLGDEAGKNSAADAKPGDQTTATTDAKQPDGKQPHAAPKGPPGPPVTVKVIDKAGYNEALQQHQGKVIVVDFWATWCEPCKERFPHMIELTGQYSEQDVVFISVSLDEASAEDQVNEFLTAHRASKMVNLLCELDPATAFEAFDIRAGIPNYKLYDRTGKVRHEFALMEDAKLNLLAADELDAKLRELLVD